MIIVIEFTERIEIANSLVKSVIKKTNHHFDFIDLGGGMGIKYNKKTKELNYARYNLILKNFILLF